MSVCIFPFACSMWLVIDHIDLPIYEKTNWHPHVVKGGVKDGAAFCLKKPHVSARGKINGRLVFIHRLILKARKGQFVDHINGDSLDNRRQNLRLVSKRENSQNTVRPYIVETRGGRWEARIGNGKGVTYLGTYGTKNEAIKVWLIAKMKLGHCDRAVQKWGHVLQSP